MTRFFRVLGTLLSLPDFLFIIVSSVAIGSLCTDVSADTFSVNGTSPNIWPGQMAFTAPCGVTFVGSPGTSSYYMAPPPVVDFSPPNTLPPGTLCASMMRTLTDPASVSVTSIGAVNPQFTGMPDGSPLPPVTTVSAVVVPQPPPNAPTTITEVSDSGTMEFDVPVNFRDTSDTMFEGRFEGVLEVPYDSFLCPSVSGTDASTGLVLSTPVLPICAINTPSDYVNALRQGHTIAWAEFNAGSLTAYASVTAYGPTDAEMPSSAQAWQRQTKGGQVSGMLAIPYGTDINSTVLRIGLRYSTGYSGQMPITWGGWPTPPNPDNLQPVDWAGMQTAWIFSQPFTIQIQPVFEVQFHYLPTLILYQPPGNQSTASISIDTTYTQTYVSGQAVTITDQTTYDQKTQSDESFNLGAKVGVLSDNAKFSDSNTWDNLTKTATGQSYGQSVSAVVSQGITSVYGTPLTSSLNTMPPVSQMTFGTEPFWSDTISFAMHPQFAVWDYPDGQFLQPLGSVYLPTRSVQQLSTCLPAPLTVGPYELSINYDILNPDNTTTHETDQLWWLECAQLLALDPFYVGLSQATAPAFGISVPPATRSLTTGVRTDSSKTMTSFTTKSTYSKTIKATVTAVRINTVSSGGGGGVNVFGIQFMGSSSSSTTTTNSAGYEVDVELDTTQSAQTQQTLTATINVADCPLVSGKTNCDSPTTNPPNIQIFQDTRFGTMMGVLPDLSITPPPPKKIPVGVSNGFNSVGLNPGHFSGVPNTPTSGIGPAGPAGLGGVLFHPVLATHANAIPVNPARTAARLTKPGPVPRVLVGHGHARPLSTSERVHAFLLPAAKK